MFKKRNLIFIFSAFLTIIYLFWRTFLTLPLDGNFIEIIFSILLLLAEISTAITSFELYYQKIFHNEEELKVPGLLPEEYPDVDIFIATHNESADLLYQTVNACTFLEYPDRRKVHIYICDDSYRPEIKVLAEKLQVHYLGFHGQHAKAGNFNHALSKTHSPLIATLDADMIVRRTFLLETVPYFFIQKIADQKCLKPMGLVQTPQSFYNLDLFQFHLFSNQTIPNEQDFFSKEINVLRNNHYAAIYTGSNAVISRQALNDIGGFPYHTITEDFETSVRLQMAGYITYSTKRAQAHGLSTTTIPSMFKQRIRWARGVIQSLHNTHACTTKKLPFMTRFSYINVYLYWWSFLARLIFILAPILFALFDIQLVKCNFFTLMIFWLPSYILSRFAVHNLSTNVRNLRWNQIIDTILAPFLVIPVFLETFGIHQKQFQVTDKKKTALHTRSWQYMIPHIFLSILTIMAIIRYGYGKFGMSLVYSSVILFWLFYNLMILLFAIFFMLGRQSYREHERIEARETIKIKFKNQIYYGKTIDLSEVALAFELSTFVDIPSHSRFQIEIETEHYKTTLQARLLYMRKSQQWLYVVFVSSRDNDEMRQYFQIMHDRDRTLPDHIDEWSSLYDDIYRNIQSRFMHFHRKQKENG